MAKLDDVKEKIKRFLTEKCNLDVASCYAVTKDLNDDFWDEWRNAEEISQENQEDFSEFDLPAKSAPIIAPTFDNTIRQQQEAPKMPDMRHVQDIRVI